MPLKRDELAADFMVQCEKGEPFECPHLADCPHEDKDLCLWQYEHADRIIEAHNTVIREIFEAGDTYCLDGKEHGRDTNFANVKKRECRKCWQALKQKYGGE